MEIFLERFSDLGSCYIFLESDVLIYLWPMFSFYTPLTTPENQSFSGVFTGYRMEALAKNE